MKRFWLNASITDLWDWLNKGKGKNHTVLKQVFDEFIKLAAKSKKRVDYRKKIDQFLTEIDDLKENKRENADEYKSAIQQSSRLLQPCLNEIEMDDEFDENPMIREMKTVLESVLAMQLIK